MALTKQLGALTLAATLLAGCASSSASKPLPTYNETRTEKSSATVVSIDQATRKVSIKTEKGELLDFVAGPEVKNLAQVKAGDQVVVEYVESIALEVRRPDGTQPDLAYAAAGGAAKPGDLPAGVVGQAVTISASVEAIDRSTNRVTLKGPDGGLRIRQVKDPKKLENVKVGDMVYVTYTEAIGISVERPAAPAAAPAK